MTRLIFYVLLLCLAACLLGWGLTHCGRQRDQAKYQRKLEQYDKQQRRVIGQYDKKLQKQKRQYESRLARARSLATPQPDTVHVKADYRIEPVKEPAIPFSTQVGMVTNQAKRKELERMPVITALERTDSFLAIQQMDTSGKTITHFYDPKLTMANFRMNSLGLLEPDQKSIRKQKIRNTLNDIKYFGYGVGTALVTAVVIVVTAK